MIPTFIAEMKWLHFATAGIALVLVRPLAGWLSLSGTALTPKYRGFVAVYGVRGIGSIYYLAYAAGHAELANLSDLWIITGLTILGSTILHGFTVGWAMDRLDRKG